MKNSEQLQSAFIYKEASSIGQLLALTYGIPGAIGAGIGAAKAPEGGKIEGAGRGTLAGAGTMLGLNVGGLAGFAGTDAARKLLPKKMRAGAEIPAGIIGYLTGAGAGGYGGLKGTQALMGDASWDRGILDR